jgi:hypothetical protein
MLLHQFDVHEDMTSVGIHPLQAGAIAAAAGPVTAAPSTAAVAIAAPRAAPWTAYALAFR